MVRTNGLLSDPRTERADWRWFSRRVTSSLWAPHSRSSERVGQRWVRFTSHLSRAVVKVLLLVPVPPTTYEHVVLSLLLWTFERLADWSFYRGQWVHWELIFPHHLYCVTSTTYLSGSHVWWCTRVCSLMRATADKKLFIVIFTTAVAISIWCSSFATAKQRI